MDFEWIRIIFKLFFNRGIRCHVLGYRPEVICVVQAINADDRDFLIIRPALNPSIWIFPQEGIEIDESISQAVTRCLNVELGIHESNMQFRRSTWLGRKRLPPDRHGERDLRYSLTKLFTRKDMIGKAYFAAQVYVPRDIKITINKAEVVDYRWVNESELRNLLAILPEDKRNFRLKALESFV